MTEITPPLPDAPVSPGLAPAPAPMPTPATHAPAARSARPMPVRIPLPRPVRAPPEASGPVSPDGVLVAGAFPPMAGPGAIATAAVVADLRAAGRRVETLSLDAAGQAGTRVAFDRAHAIRALWRSLRGRRFDTVVLSLDGVRLRQPDRWARRGVLALQIVFLLWLSSRGARLVLRGSTARGWRPAVALLESGLRLMALTPRRRPVGGTRATVAAGAGTPWSGGLDGIARLAALTPDGRYGADARIAGIAAALDAAIASSGPAAGRAAACLAALSSATPGQAGDDRAGRAALAADPRWSVPDLPVPAWAVHLRAARRALPDLQPGSAMAARQLMAWARSQLEADPALAGMAAGIAEAQGQPAVQILSPPIPGGDGAAQIRAWWLGLEHASLSRDDRAGPPVPQRRDEPASALDAAAAAGALEHGLARVLEVLGTRAADAAPYPGEIAMPAPARQALAAALPGQSGTVLGLALALLAGLPVIAIDAAGRAAIAAVSRSAAAMVPALGPLLDVSPPPAPIPRDLTLVGHGDPSTGLGANMAMTAETLRSAGIAARALAFERGLLPVTPHRERGAPPPGHAGSGREAGWAPRARRLCRPAAILHLNADRAVEALLHPALHPNAVGGHTPGMGAAPPVRIGFLLWEFGVLPPAHQLAPAMLDEIWCPTRFVAAAYEQARHPGDAPVAVVGKALSEEPVAPGGRAALGLEDGPFLFVMSFDFHASVERKNPLALARAFADAFPAGTPGGRDVRLVIKTTEVVPGHWGDPHRQWRALQAMAAADPRIRLLTGRWPAPALAALVGAADCLVSPHRAEGFGYAPARAMLQGVPVIATDYAGPRDYLDATTGWPVPCREVPVAPGEALFDMQGAVWAAIDHDALVETLRNVADPATATTRAARAAAAQRRMRGHYGTTAHAGRLLARLDALGVTAPI